MALVLLGAAGIIPMGLPSEIQLSDVFSLAA